MSKKQKNKKNKKKANNFFSFQNKFILTKNVQIFEEKKQTFYVSSFFCFFVLTCIFYHTIFCAEVPTVTIIGLSTLPTFTTFFSHLWTFLGLMLRQQGQVGDLAYHSFRQFS
jgi:hypothetical protein